MSTNSMWHPGIPVEYRDRVVCGDARILSESIPDNSIDLVFCDPVYQCVADYEWLGATAMRVLKDNSACLAWYGIGYLPQTINALLDGGLTYRWQGIWYQSNRQGARADMGFCVYSPFLWLDKGRSKPAKLTNDLIECPIDVGRVNRFVWNKQPRPIYKYIEAFTNPGDVVLDPFCGGGTVPAVCKQLGRHYIAFEIDPTTANNAQHRIDNTQPPLFVLNDEQLSLDL